MARSKQVESTEKIRTSYTLKLTPEQIERLVQVGKAKGWAQREVPYARVAFSAPDCQVTAYESGKLLVQGKGTEHFVTMVLEPEVTRQALLGYDEIHHPDWFEPHAGLDESGKGDLFGPLVSATVIAGPEAIRTWMEAGLKDSKQISDTGIVRLDRMIRQTPGIAFALVSCGMEKYNQLMAKPGANLNRLLAWQHARALEEAWPKKEVPWGLLDQFSKQNLTKTYLRLPGFELRQRTKAEEDPVVAAASVLARADFVRRLEKLSEIAGEELRKGAGPLVKKQGIALVSRHGPEILPRLAKMHFKTAREILDAAGD